MLWIQTTSQKLPRFLTIILLGLMIFIAYLPSLTVYITYIQQIRTITSNLPSSKADGNGRDRCCVSSGPELKDICGRGNCTFKCSDPVSFIPELDNEKAGYTKNENAFFIETMRNNKLDFRQACAVESLAFFNPTLKIYVLFTGGQVNYTDSTLKTLREKYGHLNFVGVNVEDYVTGTPLENWYQCTDWEKGQYHVSHLSDALRFLTLAKYGGYYFDLDVIHLRSVLDYRNFTATANDKTAFVGAIHASYGHPLIQTALQDFAKNYRADVWAQNGPFLLTNVLKKWCEVQEITSMKPDKCRGFQVLPKTSFYPVHYNKWKEYYAENNATSGNATPTWLTKEVIAVHVWNHESSNEPIRKNSSQMAIYLHVAIASLTWKQIVLTTNINKLGLGIKIKETR